MAKMDKNEFRNKINELGYEVRFKKVTFEGREARHLPIIKKDGKQINGGNVFTREFYDEHRAMFELLDGNEIFHISE